MRELLKRLVSGLRGQSETTKESEGETGSGHQPPDATRVAVRALLLAAVTARGHFEQDDDKYRATEHFGQLLDWLGRLDLIREIERIDAEVLGDTIGNLEPQTIIDAIWCGEAMVVLAWALGRAALPRYDETCDSFEVAKLLGFMRERSMTVLARPSLRPHAEIEHGRNTYLTVHWRLRQFSVRPEVIPFADYVASGWAKWGPLTLADVDLVDGDLAVQGERIDRVSEDAYHRATSIARERHKAFNWLLGFDPVYSDVRTHT